MTTQPKPMDPMRLAALKRSVERRDGDWREMLMEPQQASELLADRDYQAQRADALQQRLDGQERETQRKLAAIDERREWEGRVLAKALGREYTRETIEGMTVYVRVFRAAAKMTSGETVDALAQATADVERLRDGLRAIYSAATKVGPGVIKTETVAAMAENLLAGRAVDHGI